MPLIKANEPLGPRPVVITIQGDPGVGKSSLANTAKNPIVIDGDLGISRSIFRKDAIIPSNWEEVIAYEKEGLFKKYSTVAIDTPKAVLDDQLMSYVVRQDPKLRNNKLWAYGAIGDEFKLFLNNRRQDQADLINICHSKKDEDTKRMVPDVTGQSLQLILRVSDMIGYYTIHNGRRMIFFDPSEFSVGKNVACLPPIEVPDKADPAFRTFLADLIEKVRSAIASQSEEQLEAMKKSALYQEQIAQVETPDQLTELLVEVRKLPDYLKIPLTKLIGDKGKEKGYIPNKESLRFELSSGQPGTTPAKPVEGAPASPVASELNLETSFDDRCRILAEVGLTMELEQAAGFGLTFTYDQVGDWTEEQYMAAVGQVNDARKAPKAPRRRPANVGH